MDSAAAVLAKATRPVPPATHASLSRNHRKRNKTLRLQTLKNPTPLHRRDLLRVDLYLPGAGATVATVIAAKVLGNWIENGGLADRHLSCYVIHENSPLVMQGRTVKIENPLSMSAELLTYHRTLFQWHCRHFFNFRRKLHRLEKDYLEHCFRLPSSYKEVSEGGYEHFSYYTYSHRVKGNSVNSSRIAYGSVAHPDEAFAAAEPVLQHRAIELPASILSRTRFYGLGWDVEEEQFKVYFRTLDWTTLHSDFLRLAGDYTLDEHRPEALLSLTYEAREVAESKLYLYPKDEFLPNGVRGFARMMTDRRGEVAQEDLDPRQLGCHTFNTVGQDIIKKYESIGEPLDTVAYQAPDNFTLYFP